MIDAIVATVAVFLAVICFILDWYETTNEPTEEEAQGSIFYVDPYYAEQLERIENTRRPAGLDFALWAEEMKVKDWQ